MDAIQNTGMLSPWEPGLLSLAVYTILALGLILLVLFLASWLGEKRYHREKVRAYEKELYAVAAEMSALEARIEERERYQIAADLHDFVGQNLVLTQFKLGTLARSLTTADDSRKLEELRDVIARTIEYTRTLTVELSPPDLAEIGLSAAVEALAEGFSRAHRVSIVVRDDGGKGPLDRETRYLLYRNVRELLVNMVKHARATEATIELSRGEGRIRIMVTDNGVGFDPSTMSDDRSRFGLYAVRERMERMDGSCEIVSRPGSGTTVTLLVPISD